MNDLNNKGAEMMQIRKDLFKVNKAIEMNKADNPQQIDPYDLLVTKPDLEEKKQECDSNPI